MKGVTNQGTKQKDRGEYTPRGRYPATSVFETAVPCQIAKR